MVQTRTVRILTAGLAFIALAAVVDACAARGARDVTRVAALSIGDAAVALSQTESTVYSGGVYSKDKHDEINPLIIKVLYASRAFERAAAGWQAGSATPVSVEAARVALVSSMDDLEKAVPANATLLRTAIVSLRQALTAVKVGELRIAPVALAQGIGGPEGVLALINIIGALVTSGRSTYEKIKAALQKEGATDEELAAVDQAITDEITRREAEVEAAKADPDGTAPPASVG